MGSKEMLSIKRLIYVLLIVVVVSAVFMVYNINEERAKNIQLKNLEIEAPELTASEPVDPAQKPRVTLLGSPERDIYGDIYQNALRLFHDLHFTVTTRARLDTGRIGFDELVVFCDDDIGRYADLTELGQFVEGGGKVILASGLPEGSEDSYLWPLLAIREKSVRKNYNRLSFEEPLLPFQLDEMVYDGYSISTWLAVGSEAQVYVRDKESEVPLLYTCRRGAGGICLINGTFLSDMRCAGLLTGAAGTLAEDFIYPVVGTKAVFLDNFPMITFINDKLCLQMYGSSTEGFVRDVVWPSFQGISLRTQTPLTSSVLAAASQAKSFPAINDSLFTTIGKSALQYGGELIYAANCPEEDNIQYNQAFIDEFRSVFSNYHIQGLALQSQRLWDGMLTIPGSEIRAVRGHLGDESASFFASDSYFVLPAATMGNSMEDGNLFAIASVLGAYGMVSHVFDVNTLIAQDAATASWDRDKRQLGIFESEVLNRIPNLDAVTLSQAGGHVTGYLALEFGWEKAGNQIKLNCSEMKPGQAFFYRTGRRIADAQGLAFEEMGGGWYLLRVQGNHAVITLEEE